MNLEKINQLIFDEIGEKSSHPYKDKGNKYYHGQRVSELAKTLRKKIIPNDDSYDQILTVAAWFHDIKNGNEDHAILGSEQTRIILENHCTSEELDKICDIITVHDQRSTENNYSIYTKLHQDADLIDHFGTLEIWIDIQYYTKDYFTIPEAVKHMNELLKEHKNYRNLLNFEISKEIFDDRNKFFKEFVNRFEQEGNGKIFEN